MNRKQYHAYLRSAQWLTIAKQVRTRDKRCRYCGSRRNLEVHHLTYEYIGREEGHTFSLLTLCANCHARAHHRLWWQRALLFIADICYAIVRS